MYAAVCVGCFRSVLSLCYGWGFWLGSNFAFHSWHDARWISAIGTHTLTRRSDTIQKFSDFQFNKKRQVILKFEETIRSIYKITVDITVRHNLKLRNPIQITENKLPMMENRHLKYVLFKSSQLKFGLFEEVLFSSSYFNFYYIMQVILFELINEGVFSYLLMLYPLSLIYII